MSDEESRIRIAELEGELEDLRNRVADLEKEHAASQKPQRELNLLSSRLSSASILG